MSITVTVDTNVWLNWLDGYNTQNFCPYIKQMIDWHDGGQIILHAVFRLEYDTAKMREEQKQELKNLFNDHNIVMVPSEFRIGISPLGTGDTIIGPPKGRSSEEMVKFCKEIIEPTNLDSDMAGKPDTLKRNICDYDILYNHFKNKRDFLVTLDNKNIFQPQKRQWLEKNIEKMVIISPKEFVIKVQSLIGPQK